MATTITAPPPGTRAIPAPIRGGPRPFLSSEQQSAFDVMMGMLREWGLESLAPDLQRLLVEGHTQEQIGLLLQDTDAYKQRFRGNELRRQRGLAVLSPRDYLATEAAYRQIMESAGLPGGYYDSPEDFAEWIGNDVAPLEIKNRVDTAVDMAEALLDQDTAAAFRDFFGVESLGLAAAFVLDRNRGQQEVERAFRTGLLGGAARAQGVSVDQTRAEQLAASGIVGVESYRQAMGQVQRLTTGTERLSGIYGQGGGYGQRQAEQEVFFADEEARRRRRRLSQLEEGAFSQGSGASPQSLAQAPGQV